MPGTHMVKAIEAYSWFPMHVMLPTPGWSLRWPRIDQQGWPMIQPIEPTFSFGWQASAVPHEPPEFADSEPEHAEPEVGTQAGLACGYINDTPWLPHQTTSPIWPLQMLRLPLKMLLCLRRLESDRDSRIHLLIFFNSSMWTKYFYGVFSQLEVFRSSDKDENQIVGYKAPVFIAHQLYMLIWGQVITQDDLPAGAID